MSESLKKFLTKNSADNIYVVFRVLVGLLFFMHGAQKLFGMFGGPGLTGFSGFLASMGFPAAGFLGVFVGGIEFFGGLAIVIGLFTRLSALLGALTMAVAYFMAHFPQGYNPLANGGEASILYLVAFLIIFVQGARKFSFEKSVLGREVF